MPCNVIEFISKFQIVFEKDAIFVFGLMYLYGWENNIYSH